MLPSFAALFGTVYGLFFFGVSKFFPVSLKGYFWTSLTNQKFYFDVINNSLVVRATVVFGYLQYKLIDRGFLEFFGATGLSRLAEQLSNKFARVHNGYLLHYLLFIFCALLILLLFAVLFNISLILFFVFIFVFLVFR